MQHVYISYPELLSLRATLNLPLFFNETDQYIEMSISNGQHVINAVLNKLDESHADHITQFEGIKPLCNKLTMSNVIELKTHDFSADSTHWINGNSLYTILPIPDKKLVLKRVKMVCDKDLDFNGNTAKMVLLEGITQPVPTFTGTRTITSLDASFYKVWPIALNDNQEVSIYLKMGVVDGNPIPLWKATVFTYTSIRDMIAKGSFNLYGNDVEIAFPYVLMGINSVVLKSNMNERLEVYLENETPLVSPNNRVSDVSFMFDSWDNW